MNLEPLFKASTFKAVFCRTVRSTEQGKVEIVVVSKEEFFAWQDIPQHCTFEPGNTFFC